MAYFRITGEGFTRLARGFMLDDEPEKAWRFVTEGLGGGPEVMAVAQSILSGTQKFTGDESGFEVEDDPDSKEYQEDLAYIYAGRFKKGKSWYRPYAQVTSFGPEDAAYAQKKGYSMGSLWDRTAANNWARARAEFYGAATDIVLCLPEETHPILCEVCSNPPAWYPHLSPEKAVAAVRKVKGLHETGACTLEPVRRADQVDLTPITPKRKEVPEPVAPDYATYREAILKQAGGDMITLTSPTGKVFTTPRAPFLHWCVGKESRVLPEVKLPPWKPVCPSGLKMSNDDPFHTDWVVGAGLTPEEAYKEDLNEAAWQVRGEVSKDLLSFDCAVVVDNGSACGVVGETILMLPNLSPDHAGKITPEIRGIVTLTGGAMAHMALVASEQKITIMRVEKAIPEGTLVTLHPETGKIEILAV